MADGPTGGCPKRFGAGGHPATHQIRRQWGSGGMCGGGRHGGVVWRARRGRAPAHSPTHGTPGRAVWSAEGRCAVRACVDVWARALAPATGQSRGSATQGVTAAGARSCERAARCDGSPGGRGAAHLGAGPQGRRCVGAWDGRGRGPVGWAGDIGAFLAARSCPAAWAPGPRRQATTRDARLLDQVCRRRDAPCGALGAWGAWTGPARQRGEGAAGECPSASAGERCRARGGSRCGVGGDGEGQGGGGGARVGWRGRPGMRDGRWR